MRKIDWDKALTDEDIVFLRQMGVQGMDDRITRHQAQFGKDVSDPEIPRDETTRDVLNPGRPAPSVEGVGGGSPVKVDPTSSDDNEEESDDYDSWKVAELEDEVKARNELPDTTEVVVEGTGADGKILKKDLVKGLRLWDQQNPGALAD